MTSFEATTSILKSELAAVASTFAGLSAADWQRPTLLVPVDPDLTPWTIFELAGHFDISIGLTRMLVDGQDDSRPGRDRTSFFINPRSETAPVVYNYAYQMVDGKKPADMPQVLQATFASALDGARSVPADTVGPGYFAPMRIDEFVASRIVEAVVHGIDLTQALGTEPIATPDGIAVTAAILDDLLTRRTTGTRPTELTNDLDWILAASGRASTNDVRLPLIG